MMFYGSGGWSAWGVAGMWIVLIAFWGLVVWAIHAIIVSSSNRHVRDHHGDDAQQILDRRLARGEIDDTEHRRLHEVLDESRRAASSR